MITFAQRCITILLGAIGVASLFIMMRWPVWWVLLATVCGWVLASVCAWFILYIWQRVTVDQLKLMIATIVASTGLMFVVEWDVLRYGIAALVAGITALLYGFVLSTKGYTTHIGKTYRRVLMMTWVFHAYAILTTVYALNVFFQTIGFWVFGLIGTLMLTFISYEIWELYFPVSVRQYAFWMAMIGLLVFEMMWVMQLLPFGYTVLGLMTTWVWYILQLFFRFNFTESGVDWTRQKWFIGSNLALFFIVLYLVRWI